ncbi:MAG: hypothetical protein ACLRWQ_09395 [Flavonifractor plautii]
MYLKALEIQGFKSFLTRRCSPSVRTLPPLWAPTAAGKSNISDAIRWVMGEQSTQALAGRQDGGRNLRRHGGAQPAGLR